MLNIYSSFIITIALLGTLAIAFIILYFTKPCVTVKQKHFIITSVVLAALAIVFSILYFTEIFTNTNNIPIVKKIEVADLVDFMKNNSVTYGEMKVPIGYLVEPSYFSSINSYTKETFQSVSNAERFKKITAINNQTIGFSTYDASVWVVTMVTNVETGVDYWKEKAILLLTYLSKASDYSDSLISPAEKIIKGNTDISDPSKYWQYNMSPPSYNVGVEAVDYVIGYNFRNLPSNGYQVYVAPWVCSVGNKEFASASYGNVRINSNIYSGCKHQDKSYDEVNELYLTWSDYRPVTGENAWVMNATTHAFFQANESYNDSIMKPLVLLAKRITTTMLALEAYPNSGILYYSPQQNNIELWNVYQYSVENAASSISALVNFSDSRFPTDIVPATLHDSARAYAGRIAQRILDTHIVKDYKYDTGTIIEGYSINQGGTYVPSTGRVTGGSQASYSPGLTNGNQYATDCTSWVINVMGDKIDERYGAGTCMQLYRTLKKYNGYYENDICMGFGYSFNENDNVHSSEWSIGAMFAAKQMAMFLYPKDKAIQDELAIDISNCEKKLLEQTRTDLPVSGAGLNYCNKENYEIPFGWLGQRNSSMASTGWFTFWLAGKNPWRLDGKLNFCEFSLQPIAPLS